MGSWREQAVIDAPLEEVWKLVGDPRRYPEWAESFVEMTGPPQIERGSRYESVTRSPDHDEFHTTFEVETLDDMHEIQLRCLDSGWYSRYVLTEAGGATFADVEIGMEPRTEQFRQVDEVYSKRWYRRVAQGSLDGIRRVLARESARS